MPRDSGLIPDGGIGKRSLRVSGGTLLAVLLVAATPALAAPSESKPQKDPALLWSEFQLDPKRAAAVPTVPRILQAKRTARAEIGPALASLAPLGDESGTSPWTLPLVGLVAFLFSATAWLALVKVWRVPSRQPVDRPRPDAQGTVVPIGASRSSNGRQAPARPAAGGIRYRE